MCEIVRNIANRLTYTATYDIIEQYQTQIEPFPGPAIHNEHKAKNSERADLHLANRRLLRRFS